MWDLKETLLGYCRAPVKCSLTIFLGHPTKRCMIKTHGVLVEGEVDLSNDAILHFDNK